MQISSQSIFSVRVFHVMFSLAAGTVAGLAVFVLPPFFILAIMGGMLLLIISAWKPEIGILLIVIVTSSIVYESVLPLVPIGFGSFHMTDLLLIFLLALIPFKVLTDRNFRRVKTPLDIPLLVFYGAVLVSAYISIAFFHTHFNSVMRMLRIVTYYLIFFPIVNFITGKRKLMFFVRGLVLIAVGVAIVVIGQAIAGESVQLMPGRVETLLTLGEEFYGVTRIIPPGEALMYAMCITGVCVIVLARKGIDYSKFLKTGLLTVGILLTFARNYWITALISLALFFLLISGKQKIRAIAMLVLLTVLLSGLMPLLIAYGGRLGKFTYSITDRARSLFSVEKLFKQGTLYDRGIEVEYAKEHIKQHPLLGIGLGATYIPGGRWADDSGIFIHNGYLWILMKMGVFTLGFFLLLSATFLIRGFSKWRAIENPFLKATVIGFTLSYLSFLMSSMVAPKVMEWQAITVIGIMFGINEVIYKIDSEERLNQC